MYLRRLGIVLVLLIISMVTPTRFNAQSACPAPRLAIGNTAIVEFKPSVELRSEPDGGQLFENVTWFIPLEGPICSASGTLWWKAQSESGAVGYAPEGQGTTYWVYPNPASSPVTTLAAFQQFENGYMLWRSDAGSITVFFGKNGGGKFTTYRNRAFARLRNNPVRSKPPTGLFKPINGFGKLWGNNATLRRQLGWATGEEQTYTMTISRSDASESNVYYTLPDGRSIYTHWHLALFWGFK